MKPANQHTHVLIAGSINMDIVATAAELPSPGATVTGTALHYYPGGKGANQAVAACRAGAPTRMIGRVGTDAFGDSLVAGLNRNGVDTSFVEPVEGPSGTALIVVEDSGENSIVVIPGANDSLHPDDVPTQAFDTACIGVAQYEIPTATIEAFFRSCRAQGIVTLLNTAPAIATTGATFDLADVLILNESELSAYAAADTPEATTPEEALTQARKIRRFDDQIVVVTLGRQGAVAVDGEARLIVPGIAVDAVDTTGAGDCFVGYLAAGLAQDDPLEAALTRANAAAARSVQRPGAAPSMPSIDELC